MAGHPHADDNKIDLGVLRHGVDVVESVYGVELYLRGLGGVLVGRTDRLECVVRQEVERRDVGVGAPAAATLRHGRADDASANGISHSCVSPLGGCRAGATEARVVRRALGIIQCILNCLLSIVAGFLWRVEGGWIDRPASLGSSTN